jgi:hypothetical protein
MMYVCDRELYLKMTSSSESFNILQLIANDCYRVHIHLLGVYIQTQTSDRTTYAVLGAYLHSCPVLIYAIKSYPRTRKLPCNCMYVCV